MPESVKRRGSSGPTTGAIVERSMSSVAMVISVPAGFTGGSSPVYDHHLVKEKPMCAARRCPLIPLAALAVLPPAASADVGSPGPSIAGSSAPTGEKPQSKLWFNDGRWWAILYRPSNTRYEIFRDDDGTWA